MTRTWSRIAAVVTSALVLGVRGGHAQDKTLDTLNAYQFALQFAVPVSPAFKLVDVQSSAILRPTSFHQLASTLGDFGLKSGSVHLPKEIGFEVAPFYLARAQRLSLSDYARHAGLYRFRVSGAMKRGEEDAGPLSLAIGFRFAPSDETDPRTNMVFLNQVVALTKRINDICVREAKRGPPSEEARPGVVDCADPRGIEGTLVAALQGASGAKRDSLERALDDFRAHKLSVDAEVLSLNEELKRKKQSWADSAWNKSGLEFAVALAASTRDSLGREPVFRAMSGWLSNAMQLGSWGQLVSGLNVSAARDSLGAPMRTSAALGFATYVGGDKYKGFIEAQASLKELASSAGALADLGAEFFLTPGLWGNASAGWTLDPITHKAQLVSKLTVRTKFPFQTPSAPAAGTIPSQ